MKGLITETVVAVGKFVVLSAIWNFFLFNLGRVTLLAFTLGRYPRGRAIDRDNQRIAAAGLVVLACVWSAVAIHNHLAYNHPGYAGKP
jgi:hypothetical protein